MKHAAVFCAEALVLTLPALMSASIRTRLLVAVAAVASAEIAGWGALWPLRATAGADLVAAIAAAAGSAGAIDAIAPYSRRWRLAAMTAGVAAVASLLVAMWAHPFPEIPFYRDSAAYSYLGIRLQHGELPHRDYWDQKPGLIAVLEAVVMAGAARPLDRLFWFDIAFSLVTLGVLVWSLRPLRSGWATVAAGLWFVCFYRYPDDLQAGNLLEQYALLPMLVAIGLALRVFERRSMAGAVGVGVAAAAAGLLKPSAATALPALVLCLLLLRAEARLAGAALIAALLVVAAYFAVLTGLGTPPAKLYDDLVAVNRAYSAGITRDTIEHAWRLVQVEHWQLTIAAAGLGVALFASAVVSKMRAPALFLLFVVLGDLAGLVAPGYFYGHYFMLLAPSGALAVALGIGAGGEALSRLGSGLGRLAAAGGAAGLTVAVAAQFPLATMTSPPATLAGPVTAPYTDTAALVDALCPAGSPIAVWGSDPQIYVIASRRSSSFYFYSTPLQVRGYGSAGRTREYLRDLERRPPCAIVDGSGDEAEIPPLDAQARAAFKPVPGLISEVSSLYLVYDYVDARYRRYAVTAEGLSIYLPLAR